MNKKKIVNDPVYGFITIPAGIIYDIIEHPFFQRLRRIKQLGLTDLVYPGALHTRFSHAIGAMHLMSLALNNLRSKGLEIEDAEYESSLIAILLHDIGHGPFSHALEQTILPGTNHEIISKIIIEYLNKEFSGALNLSLKIFNDEYERKFFHQLVAGQLDIDRLDYLKRDCYFTGVAEGTIGIHRIIDMLDVEKDQLVVEEKGIYSIENFLNARRLMYWQVYLHKTTVCAEQMLIHTILRAKECLRNGEKIYIPPSLLTFFQHDITEDDFMKNHELLKAFCVLDDFDVMGAIKIWSFDSDPILSDLSSRILYRHLYQIKFSGEKFDELLKKELKDKISKKFRIFNDDLKYLFYDGEKSNAAYIAEGETINIKNKKGEIIEVAKASDLPNIEAMSKIVKKYYLCYPKNIS